MKLKLPIMLGNIGLGLILTLGTASSVNAEDITIPTDSPQYGQWNTGAGLAGEPVGGQPPKGAKPSIVDFDYNLKYQAAFQTMLWAMPAAAIYRFRAATHVKDINADDTTILSWHNTGSPRLEATTANSSTPYITAYSDLQKGPLVLEIPAASEDGQLYGQVVDAWQLTIADIGPGGGMDDGKGGKYLFTPPGYDKDIPKGYIHVASPNYRIGFALRSVVVAGKTQKDAVDYAHKLRIYYLKDVANPPKQKFINPDKIVYPTLPFFDEKAFEELYEIFSVEPTRPQDKIMVGLLAQLGIEKGKPYNPDEKTLKAMRQAAIDVWYTMENWFDNYPKSKLYWQDRQYMSLLMTDKNMMFTWEYDNSIDYLERAAEYFWCTYMPKKLSNTPSTQYMMAMGDKDGNPLLAGKNYRLTIPKDMPVKQFWALTIYDHATKSFIYTPSERTTISSYDLDTLKKNDDGSVTLYVGPKAPAGLDSNWIDTKGKRPLPAIRFYGPTEAMNNKTFKLSDFEMLK